MIYVRNNGEDYSDFEMAFIEVPESLDAKARDRIIEVLQFVAPCESRATPSVDWIAESVQWFSGKPVPLREWLERRMENLELWDDDEGAARGRGLIAALAHEAEIFG